MLSDEELKRFRDKYIDIVIKPHPATKHQIKVWNDLLWQPTATTVSLFLDNPDVPEDVAGRLLGMMAELGIACAAEVLHGVPLPIDHAGKSMRRWQLKRELGGIVEQMTDAQLQALAFYAQGRVS